MNITNHFVDRYFQRVLKTELPDVKYDGLKQIVRKDMDLKMTPLQKSNMLFLSGSGSRSKIPMGGGFRLVTDNNSAITVY